MKTTTEDPIIIPPLVLAAVKDLIAHHFDDEPEGYLDAVRDGDDKDHHFIDVIDIAEWLSTLPITLFDWPARAESLKRKIAKARAEARAEEETTI